MTERRDSESLPEGAIAEIIQSNGLQYSTDAGPGFARKRWGRGFRYFEPAGEAVSSDEHLHRIRKLAIPPAYENVWICSFPNGHLQATGYDAKRRKQYRYHELWQETRNVYKFENLLGFAQKLPALHDRVSRRLAEPDFTQETLCATAVRLLDKTGIRIGNPSSASENQAFGLTTLRHRHLNEADEVGGKVSLRRGESFASLYWKGREGT